MARSSYPKPLNRRWWQFWRPHVVIGGNDPYLLRWRLTPRNPCFSIYLHKFQRSDDPRALHDHPYSNVSLLLQGRYIEHLEDGETRVVRWMRPVFRTAEAPHRVELYHREDGTPIRTWSLFFCGPRRREWGFHCPQGWRPWREYVALTEDGNEIGPGCN